jgi:hypothetical protein
MAYLRRDIEHQLDSASFVAAALERLDAAPASITIDAVREINGFIFYGLGGSRTVACD